KECRVELNDFLGKEEAAWTQRPKQYWLRNGDLNTKFFHRLANRRRIHKALSKLQDDNGNCEESDEGMGRVAAEYFGNLFRAGDVDYEPVVASIEQQVTPNHNNRLLAPFREQDFKDACFVMHPDKEPGPDGLNPAFYQQLWDIVGADVTADCMKWLETGIFPVSVRPTNIILLPKKANPTTMRDVRPISLCDVRYRIVVKVLANRLRRIMLDIILEEQSGFLQSRYIVDDNTIFCAIFTHITHSFAWCLMPRT
ncbi:Transposon TX1 uncharacterized 149 kDa protein, partial [Linum grandiflorum]